MKKILLISVLCIALFICIIGEGESITLNFVNALENGSWFWCTGAIVLSLFAGKLMRIFDTKLCKNENFRFNAWSFYDDPVTRLVFFVAYVVLGFLSFPSIFSGILGVSLLFIGHFIYFIIGKMFKIYRTLDYINFWVQESLCMAGCWLAYFFLPEEWLWWKYYVIIVFISVLLLVIFKIIGNKNQLRDLARHGRTF